MDFSAALVLIYNIQSPLNYSFMFLSFLKPLTFLLCLSACPGESANSSRITVRHTRMHTCARAHRHACRHARRDTALDSSAWQRLVTHEIPSESVDSELPRWGASRPVILSCARSPRGRRWRERRDPPVTLTVCPEELRPHCSLSYSWARMHRMVWWALWIWALGELCYAFSRFFSTYYSRGSSL